MSIDKIYWGRPRHTIFLCLKNGTLEKNEPYQINVVMGGGTFLNVGGGHKSKKL